MSTQNDRKVTLNLHPEVTAILDEVKDPEIRSMFAAQIHSDLRVELQKIVAERMVRSHLGYNALSLQEKILEAERRLQAITPEQRAEMKAKIQKKIDALNASAIRQSGDFGLDFQIRMDEAQKLANLKAAIIDIGSMSAFGLVKGASGTYVVELKDGGIVSANKIEKKAQTFFGRIKAFFLGQKVLFKELFAK